MKKFTMILSLTFVANCFATADSTDKQQTTEVVTLGVVAYAMTSRTTVVQGNCFVAGGGCIEYVTGWSSSTMTTDCNAVSGTLTQGNVLCSTTSRVASCAVSNRGFNLILSNSTAVIRFYTPTSLSTATTSCNSLSGVTTSP